MRAVQEKIPAPEPINGGKESEGPQRRLLRGYLHKTSNGLCGIKGYASLIAEGGVQEGSSVQWAKKIIHEVERMEEIFRSVGDLNHTREKPGKSTGIHEVVTDAVRRCSLRHENLNIETGFIPVGELLLPAADLGMILDEVIANSAEARDPAMDYILVRISGSVGPQGRVSLTIQDNGPGIEECLIRQVADPFVTTRSGHLGIGLTRIETLLDMYGLGWKLSSELNFGTAVTLEVGKFAGWMPERNLMKRKVENG
ncbi:MAG: HAMP domain-containing histidine kinase [Gemmatimonadales bacterium]|nr:HAMP domain-containing histidine kinase [Gemmatimonadales bacterium]